MSDTLECNYCTLRKIKAEAKKGGGRVIAKRSGAWREMYVQGKRGRPRYKISFLNLTDHCVC